MTRTDYGHTELSKVRGLSQIRISRGISFSGFHITFCKIDTAGYEMHIYEFEMKENWNSFYYLNFFLFNKILSSISLESTVEKCQACSNIYIYNFF